MSSPLRWKNCHADVVSSRYGPVVKAFLADIVEPSLKSLDGQVSHWAASDDPVADFIQGDVEDLRRATVMAFCLSIQSLWEQQIRAYLRGCARELKFDQAVITKLLKAPWPDLDRYFEQIRGIAMSRFEQYPDLSYLHLLGNACRHGDGPSLEALSQLHPELWPDRYGSQDSSLLGEDFRIPPWTATIDNMVIPRELLGRFVNAVWSFWDEAEYIYNESIERKHPSLVAQLVKERLKRSKK